MKAGVGLVLEEAAAEAQDADKLWPIADGGLGGGKTGEELKAEGNETPPTHNNRSRASGGGTTD